MKRRYFVGLTTAAALRPQFTKAQFDKLQGSDKLRVAVIGHTGRGNYGHGLDTVWLRLADATTIVGVADADAGGLAAATQRLGTAAGYRDYRELLAATRPEIVAVCPRHPDQHHAMIMAAIEQGAHGIYCEKPFCRTPAEADAIVAACEQKNVKLAVGHRNRYHPALQAVERIMAAGEIGKVLEIRGRGKGDRRGGGEDLWVLGSHVFNLFDYFGQGVKSCSAVMRTAGRLVTKADVSDGNEGLGPIAGDEIHARFELNNGIIAYFDSMANDDTQNAAFGLQIIGSRGVIDFKIDQEPLAHLIVGNPFQIDAGGKWVPISSSGVGQPEVIAGLADAVSHHETSARDLLQAIQDNRAPLCDVHAAALTVEMIHAVFASHRQNGQAVNLPLAIRSNQLLMLE